MSHVRSSNFSIAPDLTLTFTPRTWTGGTGGSRGPGGTGGDGGSVPVPDPDAIGLVGVGLVGLGLTRRRAHTPRYTSSVNSAPPITIVPHFAS